MKHLFFDLDRTLWDFEKNSEKALNILFHDLGLDKQLRSFQGFHKTYKEINAKLWYDYGRGKITKDILRIKRFQDTLSSYKIDSPDLAKRLGDGYVEISPYQTQLFPNTKEVLTDLKKEYELHIITNGFKEVQFIKLENSGIRDFFDVIVCSEDVGKNKPAPDVFHYSLSQAGAKAHESIMIGDDYQVDVIGAEGAGIKGVLFDPHKKYNEGTHEFHINDLIEMHDILPWISKV
ncbi:MAG: YjjG family noncanonical pyrimidine nucleotidase [Crocinitomicaceae bacterium]